MCRCVFGKKLRARIETLVYHCDHRVGEAVAGSFGFL